jgi:DNA-directed RNA polymerase subunit RPC12/RpoP
MSESPTTYPCPACSQEVPEPADPSANLLECPNCGNQFFIKRAAQPRRFGEGGGSVADRVHELAKGRRALIRYRSYFVVAALGCFIFAGQAVYTIVRTNLTPTGRNFFGIVAVLLVVGGVYFTRRALDVTRKLKRPL